MCVCVCVCVCMCVCLCVFVCVFVCVCVCVCTDLTIIKCVKLVNYLCPMHARTHTYIHTYVRNSNNIHVIPDSAGVLTLAKDKGFSKHSWV